MAKRVFFSFHYQDVADFRANVVRQHWMTKPDREAAGFFDASIWESAKKTGSIAVKRLINGALQGTSTTCVLIGSDTYLRPWVKYEILKSFRRGNSLLAVHINSIKGKNQQTKPLGPNPLQHVGVTYSQSGETGTLWHIINNSWIEYGEIDGGSSFRTEGVNAQYHGKGFNLSRFASCHDWVADNGYSNFGTWVA